MKWNDMTMAQKSKAISIMVRNGVTDLDTMRTMWDSMDDRKKPSYEQWSKGVNKNFLSDDYNLRAAYEELPYERMEAWRTNPSQNHLPDTYKYPWHKTFSAESVDPVSDMQGGVWLQDRFYPSETNRTFNPNTYRQNGAYVETPVGMLPERVKLPATRLSFAEGGSVNQYNPYPLGY